MPHQTRRHNVQRTINLAFHPTPKTLAARIQFNETRTFHLLLMVIS